MQREAERHVRGRGGKRRAERAGRARREGGVPPGLAGGARGCHVLSTDALSPRPVSGSRCLSSTGPAQSTNSKSSRSVVCLFWSLGAQLARVAALLTGGPAGAAGQLPRPLGRELGGPRAASTKGREWEWGDAKGGTQRPALLSCCCLVSCIGVLTPGLSFLICKLGRM